MARQRAPAGAGVARRASGRPDDASRLSAHGDSQRQPSHRNKRGAHVVAPEPIADAGFSWERVHACQCIAYTKYCIAENCDERSYFTATAAEALLASKGVNAPKHELLPALCAAIEEAQRGEDTDAALQDVLNLRHVQYGQLVFRRHPPINAREPPRNCDDYQPEVFEMYDVTEEVGATGKTKTIYMVQAPSSEGGFHYEFTDVRKWPWTMVLLFDAKPLNFDKDQCGDPAEGMVDYAVELRLAYRSKEHVFTEGQSDREQCVKVSVGEINIGSGGFTAWKTTCAASNAVSKMLDCVMLGDKSMVDQLFYQSNWRLSQPSLVDDCLEPLLRQPTVQARYMFEIIDNIHCVQYIDNRKKEQTPQWIELANFSIVKLLNIYQFVESGDMPYRKLLCRHLLCEDGEGTIYISADDNCRVPLTRGAKYLDVEVLVDISKIQKPSDVKGLFQSFHANLDAYNMSADHLSCIMATFDMPEVERCINRFGRQIDGVYVMGNCAFKDGQIMTLEDARYSIVPKFFEDAIMPMPRSEYPRIIQCPFPHVRYVIGMKVWVKLMPHFFANNLMPAKAVFAMAVMGMHASKMWSGQSGFGHGFPVTWVYSSEPNTGKTEACLLAHGMLGFYHRAIWAGQ